MSSANEQPCPDCGEMVRINSVRCWNCGAFMNRELEAKYMELQAKPDRMIFSEIPEGDIQSYQSEESGPTADAGDDFELTFTAPVVPSTPTTMGGPTATPRPVDEKPAKEAISEAFSAVEPRDPQEPKANQQPLADAASDALLQIARQDEAEARERRKGRRVAGTRTVTGGFVIFCPYGCKIEVKEEHRGKNGRCPKCRAPFIVPIDPPMFKTAATTAVAGATAAPTGAYSQWLIDLHVHVVSLEKLKLKADSLLKEFVDADFAFGPEQLVVLELAKKAGGLFGGGGDKKKLEVRDASQQHLRSGKPVEELTVAQKYAFTRDHLSELKVVQPAASRTDSIFHGIPVFGEGRIAVQLPFTAASKDPLYVSMGLTQFWEFGKAVQALYGIVLLSGDGSIPLDHVYAERKCHYTNETFKTLENVPLYQADSSVQLEVVGYRCGACSLIVSEAGRDREKLGGKSPKGIGKAKCPKCQQKMGENFLYKIKEVPPTEGTTPATK